MKEALGSSETSALTRATQLNIPEDPIHMSKLWFDEREPAGHTMCDVSCKAKLELTRLDIKVKW
jgi:hypothetical protein